MNRFHSENIMNQLQEITVRFPVSILFIVLSAFWELSLVHNISRRGSLSVVLLTGFLFSTATQLFFERFFKKNENQLIRWLLYGGVLILMVLYSIYFSSNIDNIDGSWTIYSIPGIRALILYFILTLLLAWIPSIKSPIKFSESFLAVFKAYFAGGFFALVLFLGLIAVFFLFERLFFYLEMDWFAYSYIVSFLIFMPLIFLTFIPKYEELNETPEENDGGRRAIDMPNFLDKLIRYIFIPIMAIYTLLLVLYIVSNLTSVFFKDNLLEGLILAYAINGWTLLILADLMENKMIALFKKVFPFFLIFVIAFQMLSTFREIQLVGMTHGRYFILIFGVGSIISALWYMFKEPKLWLLPIVSLIAGVIALVPPFDAVSVSVRDQVNRIEHLLEVNNILAADGQITPNQEMPIDTKNQVNESIRYLRSISALNQLSWLPEHLYTQTHELFGFNDELDTDAPDPPAETIRYTIEISNREQYSLPVDAYNYMLEFTMRQFEEHTETIILEGENVNLHIELSDDFLLTLAWEETNEETVFDFSDILDSFEKEDATLPIEEMMFVKESDERTATIFLKYLYVYEDRSTIEFILFL